jgi:F0F1-type ATP synthase membrane subunit c/vacuolar-type H+-ATPase subunit K
MCLYEAFILVIINDTGKSIGAGFAAIGFAGAWIGVGKIFGSLILGIVKNPSKKKELVKIAIIGFIFTEAIAVFALMIIIFLLFFTF